MSLVQVLLTRIPIVSYHVVVLILYGSIFLAFLWIFGGVRACVGVRLDLVPHAGMCCFTELKSQRPCMTSCAHHAASQGAVLARRCC
jgi:hypothetical protein